jgi:hypothetical protein
LARATPHLRPAHDIGRRRPTLIASVMTLYLACYWVVTRVTAARPPSDLFDTAIPLDQLIPHLPATWPLYWLAYPFVIVGGGVALCRMDQAWAQVELRDVIQRRRTGQPYSPGAFATAYADLRNKDETLRWLDSMLAVRDPGLPQIEVDPVYDFLRGDPRYDAWLAKLPWRHRPPTDTQRPR